VRPWDAATASGYPHNGHTGRRYNGINVMLLWLSGHTDPRWYTYKQAREHGESHVRKGQKGTQIVFWRFIEKDEKDANGQPILDANGKPRKTSIPFLRVFTVFNHTQIEWEEGHEPGSGTTEKIDPEEAFQGAFEYFERLPVNLTHAGGQACYSSKHDTVTLPPMATFNTAADYWATRAHETVHWTGHKSRCDRQLGNRFGSDAYAAEELIAEMGAAFLCAGLGIPGDLQHASYIDHWVKVLKADKYAIFTAARKAQDAVAYLDEMVADNTIEEEGTTALAAA